MTADLVSILDKDGKAQKGKDPNLPKEELQLLYRLMVSTRLLDERGLAMQRQGRIGFYLQSTGQEASHIGAAYALDDGDWLFPAYRQPGILLLREVAIDKIVSEPLGGAHRDPKQMAVLLKRALADSLRQFQGMKTKDLLAARHEKLMSYGKFKEIASAE